MPTAASRFADLRDPLLERDYSRLCSRASNFRNRALFTAVLGLVLLLTLSAQRREAALDEVGWTLHLVFTWGAAFFVSMQALTEAATAVPTERATGTLTVLLTVPRSHRRLAAGFLLSRLALALTSFLAILPLEGIALLLGGVSGGDLLLSLATIATAAVFSASVGLFAGHGAPGHRQAVGRATFLSAFLTVLLPLLLLCAAWLLSLDRPTPPPAATALEKASGGVFLANPLSPLVHITSRRLPFPGFGVSSWVVFGLPAAVAALYAVGAVLGTGRGLTLEDERAAVGSGGGLRRLLGFGRGRRASAEKPLPAPAAIPAAGARVWSRPLWWMEARPPRHFLARWGLRTVVVGYALVVLWVMIHPKARANLATPEGFGVYDFLLGLPWWAVGLAILAASGTFLAEEREKSSLDLLRAAPLSPADFALARPLGILWKTRHLLGASLLLAAAAAATRLVHPATPPAWLLGFLLLLPFHALLSFRLGMGARTVRQAGRRMGLVVGGVVLGWPLAVSFLALLTRNLLDRAVNEGIVYLFALDPPVAMLGPMLLEIQWIAPGRDDDFLRFALVAAGAAVGFLVLGALLWRGIPAALDRALHGEGGA